MQFQVRSLISLQMYQPMDIEPLVANYVRWDAYKKAGYPTINTLDDMILFKEIQSNTPKSDSGKKTYAISYLKTGMVKQ